MATSLVDPASEDATAQRPPDDAPQATPTPVATRPCASCGAGLEAGQDWCLQCGAAAGGTRGQRQRPRWGSGAVLLGASAALVLAAAGAGYAALSKSPPRPRLATVTVAAPAAAAPPAAASPPATPPASLTATTPKPTLPAPTTVAPAKVPLAIVTPTKTAPATTPTTSTPSGETPTGTTPSSGEAGTEPQANALLLDTNAASSFNPNAYPPSDFGDPSLAIDGDVTTGWSAIVEPATAPKLADGLLIDLRSPQKLSKVELVTSTPGMSIQIFGAVGAAAPTTITDSAWAKLTTSKVDKQKRSQIKLAAHGNKYRFVLLWVSKAPASAVGTPQKPGHVVVDELELFP